MKLKDFEKLATENVHSWAVGTLEEWLAGYTPMDENVPVQYRVTLLDDGTYLFTPSTYSVEDGRRRPVQQFKVEVKVTEVPR